MGTIESLHCGDGVIDDARFLGRDVSGYAAVNAHRSLAGLARGLTALGIRTTADEFAI